MAIQLGRRSLLRFTGRGVIGFAVLGVVGCGGDDSPSGAETPAGGDPESSPVAPGASSSDSDTELDWERVDLGFVSAYVLVRGRQAAVVDTGVEGSAEAIGTVLDTAGPGWAGVRHVVLTHQHPDHAGSTGAVLERATEATGYAGAADLDAIDASGLQPLADGDDVFGLQIVSTPGHTAGHVAVFDAATGVLFAGDALSNPGELTGSPPDFTADPDAAAASVRKLAELAPRTILVGHGPPVTQDAAAVLSALSASL